MLWTSMHEESTVAAFFSSPPHSDRMGKVVRQKFIAGTFSRDRYNILHRVFGTRTLCAFCCRMMPDIGTDCRLKCLSFCPFPCTSGAQIFAQTKATALQRVYSVSHCSFTKSVQLTFLLPLHCIFMTWQQKKNMTNCPAIAIRLLNFQWRTQSRCVYVICI